MLPEPMPGGIAEAIASPPEETSEKLPRGANVTIDWVPIRHGEREGMRLNDYGRKTTQELTLAQNLDEEQYDAVKATGSNVDAAGTKLGIGRSLETAVIMADTVTAGPGASNSFTPRAEDLLNYTKVISKRPYDHTAIYNSFLPENFAELSPEAKAEASKQAQTEVTDYLFRLETPEAIAYKKEIAGRAAWLVDHYQKMAHRLKDNSKVLIPAGSHGGNMELLLQYAMVRKLADGGEIVGFKDASEIGGAMDPSESYRVRIATNEQGENLPLTVTFNNPSRPQAEAYLDPEKVQELRNYYLAILKRKELADLEAEVKALEASTGTIEQQANVGSN